MKTILSIVGLLFCLSAQAQSSYIEMANQEIVAAVRAGDFAKADRLATTAEQLAYVAEAKERRAAAAAQAKQDRRGVVCTSSSYDAGGGYRRGTAYCR